MTSYCRGVFELSAHRRPTVGDTKLSVINYDHMGWLKCDGRQLSVAEYRFLFEVIGYSFGGSGANFYLPDPAGRVPGIVGSGAGLTPRDMGSNVGEETHTLTISEMPSHNHGVNPVPGQVPTNNLTSEDTHNHSGNTGFSLTGITGTSNAGEHFHTGTTDGAGYAASSHQVAVSWTTTGTADDGGSHSHTFTTSNAGIHSHGIYDPTHRHTIENYTHSHTMNPAGGSNAHNNMQPTLFIGNMFMFSNKGPLTFENVPYTLNTNVY